MFLFCFVNFLRLLSYDEKNLTCVVKTINFYKKEFKNMLFSMFNLFDKSLYEITTHIRSFIYLPL